MTTSRAFPHDKILHPNLRISEIENRYDIFTKLPIELSQQIAQELEIFQVFQAQRVSKSWRQILSSSDFLDHFYLRPWFGQRGRIPRKPEGLSFSPTRSSRAEQIDAFRYGRARMASGSCHILPREDLPYHGGSIYYAGGIFAQIPPGLRCIHLRCLRTGTTVRIFVPNGERVGMFAMSTSKLAVITTDGNVYVWKVSLGLRMSRCLNPESPELFEVPCAIMDLLIISNSALAKVFRARTGYQVTIWNLMVEEICTFIIRGKSSWPALPGSIKIINTGEKDSMVFFERILDDESFVHFTRFTVDGQIISEGTILHPNISDYTRQSDNSDPSNVHGCVTIWSYTRQDENELHVLRICYNTRRHRLEIKKNIVENKIGASHGLGVDFFWWQEMAYVMAHGTRDANAPRHLRIVDLEAGACRKAENDWKITKTECSGSTFVGDTDFLIFVGHSGNCSVWCFDKSSPLADETDTTFS